MRSRQIALFLIAVLLTAAAAFSQTAYDAVIRGGRVFDGAGNPWRYVDIAIRDGRIAAIGKLGEVRARRIIDAKGFTVTPGFIDVHTHAGPGLGRELNHAQPLISQGITSVIVNPDGGGPVDIAGQKANYKNRGMGVNIALFLPHGSIRRQVLGMSDRSPNGDELAQMKQLVRQGMEAGAIGMSTGLYYAPGSYSKTEEIIALAEEVARYGGVHQSHLRDESDYNIGLIASLDELIRISETAKLPGVVTHLKALGKNTWGLAHAATMRIEGARARGVEIFADQYPYEASSTSIVGAIVPRWAQVGGDDELRKRLDGSDRNRLAGDIETNIERRGGPETIVIARFEPDPAYEGKNLAELAAAHHKSPVEVVFDIVRRGSAGVVSFNMTDQDIEHIMRQPYTMTCTDGALVPMGEGKPHPRAYGSFPHKLRVYVRERGVIDWAFAIRSMTSLPAAVYRMEGRGILQPGAWADVLVFDSDKIRDLATYQEPHQLSKGIQHVLVNGEAVMDGGTFTNKLPGRIIEGPGAR